MCVCVLLVLKNLRRRSSTVCRSFLPNEDDDLNTLSHSQNGRAFNTTPSTKERKREKNNNTFAFRRGGERELFRDVGTRSTAKVSERCL